MTTDDLLLLLGAKEAELFDLRRELANTKRVLEQVTSGEDKKNTGAEAAEASGEGDDGEAV